MAYVSLYTGSDGESHIKELDMGFAPTDMSPLGGFSPAVARAPVYLIPEKVKAVIIGSQTEENNKGFRPKGQHSGGQRHYVVFLGGRVEIETSDGNKRIFEPGDWLVDEDQESRGHHWRILDPPWEWCAIMLEE